MAKVATVVSCVPHDDLVGAWLGERYRVLERLGAGGMGVVYRAHDRELGCDIALKVIAQAHAGQARRRERLRAEVRNARRVTHRNVCRVFDLVDADETLFVTMELLEGEPLSDRLARGGRAAMALVVATLRDVAHGLAAAHRQGVVHRDVKPGNVLLAPGRAVLVDFGIAHHLDPPTNGRLTADGEVVGTPSYSSPEQLRGEEPDPRTDVYAFGMLAYEMLVGLLPVRGLPPAVEDLRKDVPPDLAALVGVCLEPEPDARLRDGDALVEALERLEAPRRHQQRTTLAESTPSTPRSRVVPLVLVAGAIALSGAVFLYTMQDDATAVVATPGARPATVRIEASRVSPSGADPHPAPPPSQLAAGLPAALADELRWSWGIEASLGPAGPAGPADLVVTLESDATADLIVATWGDTDRAELRDEPTAAAVSLAGSIAEDLAPARALAPSPHQLAAAGTTSADAWRDWRRARRSAMFGDPVRAERLARRALAADPSFPLPALEVAALHDPGDVVGEEAIAFASEHSRRVSPRWRLEIDVYKAYYAGDLDAMSRHAASLHAAASDDPYVQLRLAAELLEGDAVDEGLGTLENMMRRWPHDPTPALALAHHHLAAYELAPRPGAHDRALALAGEAVRRSPGSADARAALAVAAMLAGDDALARREAEVASLWDPHNLDAALAGVGLGIRAGDHDAAAAAARRLLAQPRSEAEANPLDGPARTAATGGHYLLGLVDLGFGRFDRGLDRLETAAAALEATSPSAAAEAHANIGWYALQLGEYERASAAFDAAFALRGSIYGVADDDALLRAVIDHRHGDAAARFELRQRAAALAAAYRDTAAADAGAAEVHLRLFAAWVLEDWSIVLETFRGVETLPQLEPWVLFAVAEAHNAANEPESAATAYRALINHSFAWDEPVLAARAWYELARLEDAAGDAGQARRAYARYIVHHGRPSRPLPKVEVARQRLAALTPIRETP